VLFFVLILVLAALGALVAALVTSKALFAWISIGFSVAAAVGLFADWVKRRRAERRAAGEPAADEASTDQEDATRSSDSDQPADDQSAEAASTTEQAELPEDLPGEEETDAADLLIVCELSDEVLVIDEQPRYHLATCAWLKGNETIPIAVSEARELGFTPCARCGPDATLAERARRKRVADTS